MAAKKKSGTGAARKTRCLSWSKGKKRCLRRAKTTKKSTGLKKKKCLRWSSAAGGKKRRCMKRAK